MRTAAVAAVMLLALGSCTGGGGSTETAVTDPPVAVDAPLGQDGAGEVVEPLDLEWAEVHSSDGDASIGGLVATDHGLYAIGTMPPYERRVLYRSADGVTWTESDIDDVFGEGASVEAIAATDEGALAVGALVSDEWLELMAWTTGDGSSWSPQPLGATIDQPPSQFESLSMHAGVATSALGALVSLDVGTELEWDPIEAAIAAALPEGLDITGRDSNYALAPGGTIVVTAGPLVVYRSPLSELGLDEEMIVTTIRWLNNWEEGRERFLFFTSDLTTWVEHDAAVFDPLGFAVDVAGADDAFVATVSTGWGTDVYASTDGATWQRVAAPGEVHGLATHDGEVLGVVRGPTSTTIWTSSDGLTWRPDDRVAGSDVPDTMRVLASGGLGLFGIGEQAHDVEWDPENEPPTVIDHGGVTLRMTRGADGLTVTDSTGAVVFSRALYARTDPQFEPIAEMSFDYAERTMTIEDEGDDLITVTFDELAEAYAAALEAAGIRHPSTPPTPVLWAPTIDGSWTTEPVDVVDPDSWVSALAVTADAVVLVSEPAVGGFQLWRGVPTASPSSPG